MPTHATNTGSRRLRWTYITALALVACLTIAAQWFIQTALDASSMDGRVIDVAGRQRMLSQRIAKAVATLSSPALEALREPMRRELAESLDEWSEAHFALIHGSSDAGLPGLASDDPLRARMQALSPMVESTCRAAAMIARAQRTDAAHDADATYVIHTTDRYLPRMNALVRTFADRQRDKVARLRTLEWSLASATLLVLLLEAVLVFEPAIRTIRRQFGRLRKLQQKANASAAAKDVFLARVSHEIRTPLTAIRGYSDLLRGGHLAEPEREPALRSIGTNTEHLLGLVNDLIDTTMIQSGELEVTFKRCDLRRTLNEALQICELQARASGVSVAMEIHTRVPVEIRSDGQRLRQCVVNLVTNALRHAPGGRVAVEIRASQADRALTIDVADSGPGIPRDHLDRIFDPFHKVDSRSEGTGLGLTITRRLANLLGGDVGVLRTSSAGTVFRLTIAIREDHETTWVDHPLPEPESPPPHLETLEAEILVVDDVADNTTVLRHMLQSAGAAVATDNSGTAGLDAARAGTASGRPFDLILLDRHMPDMDGFEVTRTLRAEGYSGPILALTASAQAGVEQEALDAGCNAYLAKPIRHHSLIRAVSHWLEHTRSSI